MIGFLRKRELWAASVVALVCLFALPNGFASAAAASASTLSHADKAVSTCQAAQLRGHELGTTGAMGTMMVSYHSPERRCHVLDEGVRWASPA